MHKEELAMKVLVHLNHGVDKSYMLNFGRRVTKEDIAFILKKHDDRAVEALLGYAVSLTAQKTEVPQEKRQTAGFEADYVVSQHGYTTERLA